MANPKDVLVVTTSSLDGLQINRYIKAVSAHVVAGTNVFSDFVASFSDVFGGRSQAYQKQLVSLYNEAIEQIKYAAFEIGANGIIGLNIDMDEISGKGKSMFMLTAIGTAVVIDKEIKFNNSALATNKNVENVALETINSLREKKRVIENADSNTLRLDDKTWTFITQHQVDEIFPFMLKRLLAVQEQEHSSIESSDKFYNAFGTYVDALPEQKKLDLLYSYLEVEADPLAIKLISIINQFKLFDFSRIVTLLENQNFEIKKRGLQVSISDKAYYSIHDVQEFQKLKTLIGQKFEERGTRTMKKQLLSSKEKEVWICECGKANDIGSYCNGCNKDIYGFKASEIKPQEAIEQLEENIELILEYTSQ